MTDNDFLQWIYDRMVQVHNENELVDYMHKFKGIIEKNKMTEKDKNQMVPLCCDCKHYRRDWISHIVTGSDGLDKCLNPIVNENLVSGKNEGKFCEIQRRSYGGCGRDGKYFEARK